VTQHAFPLRTRIQNRPYRQKERLDQRDGREVERERERGRELAREERAERIDVTQYVIFRWSCRAVPMGLLISPFLQQTHWITQSRFHLLNLTKRLTSKLSATTRGVAEGNVGEGRGGGGWWGRYSLRYTR